MMRVRAAAIGVLFALAWNEPPARAQSDPDPEAAVGNPPSDEYADTDPSALSDFRPALDPHGTWVEDPQYGAAWTPAPNEVGPDFQPYDTAGRWDYTDGDYVWSSDYSWGWVCFHYGRWAWSFGRWIWVPGRLYAGAWVNWRIGDADYSYLGWAPTPPAWRWVGESTVALGFWPPEFWMFAAYGDVFGPGLPARVVGSSNAAALAQHTRPYVPAQPIVTAQSPARPAAHGPPPALLGIDVGLLSHPSVNPHEIRARQYAHPSTAVPLGGHAPTPHGTERATVHPPPAAAPPSHLGASAHGRTSGRR